VVFSSLIKQGLDSLVDNTKRGTFGVPLSPFQCSDRSREFSTLRPKLYQSHFQNIQRLENLILSFWKSSVRTGDTRLNVRSIVWFHEDATKFFRSFRKKK
jgi:hypothetical protein